MAETTKRKRARSPKFPGIDLKTAIAKATALYEKEPTRSAPQEIVLKHWNYSSKSGAGLVALGAVRGFGLVETVGKEIKLTDLALDILQDDRPGSTSRQAALWKAALLPSMHAILWKHYNGTIPSDDTLRFHLRRDRGFTDKGADDFIKQFRATLAFANSEKNGKISGGEGEETEGEPPLGEGGELETLPIPPVLKVRPGMNQDTFTLDEGKVVLQWPSRISPENYKDLKDWLDLMNRRIKRAVIATGDEQETE